MHVRAKLKRAPDVDSDNAYAVLIERLDLGRVIVKQQSVEVGRTPVRKSLLCSIFI